MSAENPIAPDFSLVRRKDINRAEWRLRNAEKLIKFVDNYNALETVSSYIEDGAYPVFFSNHNQHINGNEFRRIARKLQVRPKDLYVAIAQSLTGGEQGEEFGVGARAIEALMSKDEIHFLKFARPQDVEFYRKKDPKKARQLLEDTRRMQDFLRETVHGDAGFMFFPEGTTQSGVKRPDGTREGMVEVETPLFLWIINEAEKTGREVIFSPFANVGTNNIVEPRTTDPHLRARFEIVKSEATFGLVRPYHLAEVRMGRPFTLSNIRNSGLDLSNKREVNEFAMIHVAQEMPVEDQGYYAQFLKKPNWSI